MLAALEDEANARAYYWFAALYALPLLTNGFDQDAFSIALLLTGAVHVQVGPAAAARGCGLVGARSRARPPPQGEGVCDPGFRACCDSPLPRRPWASLADPNPDPPPAPAGGAHRGH